MLNYVIPLCFGGAFVLLGAGLLFLAARSERKAEETRAWPTVPGKVLQSSIIEGRSTDSDGHTSTSYRPSIRYSYEVDGTKFTGERLNRGMVVAFDHGRANRIVQAYPVDASVPVSYNPAQPSDSVLETKARGGGVLRIVGIAIIIAGMLCTLGGLGITYFTDGFMKMFGV